MATVNLVSLMLLFFVYAPVAVAVAAAAVVDVVAASVAPVSCFVYGSPIFLLLWAFCSLVAFCDVVVVVVVSFLLWF